METFNEFRQREGLETLNDVLSHYGVMGMRWGVRRSDKQIARDRAKRREKGKPVTKTSADAERAAEAQKKAKKGGVKALSNDELKELNKRLNLETEYSRLTEKDPQISRGRKAANAVLNEAGKMAANVARSEGQRILAQEVRKKVIGA